MSKRLMCSRTSPALVLLLVYTFSVMFWDYLIESKVAAGILILGGIILLKGKFRIKVLSYIWTYLTFILFFIIHTAFGFSRNPDASWNAISTMALNLVIAFVSVEFFLQERAFLEKYMKGFVWCVLLVTFYNVAVKFPDLLNGKLTIDCPKLFSSEVYSHNDVPGYAVIALFFIVYFMGSKKISRKVALIEITYLLVFILLSGARKSLIGAIIAVFIYPYMYMNKGHSLLQKLFRIGLVMVGIVLLYIIITKNSFLYNLIGYKFEDVFQGLISGEFEESSAASRNRMLIGGMALIRQNLYLGYGLRSWASWIGLSGSWAHNMIIELTFSGGILAPIIYYLFYIDFFAKLKRNVNNDLMASMMLMYMFFMLIHEMLSVSYLSRMVSLMYCVINAYLIFRVNEKQPINRNM